MSEALSLGRREWNAWPAVLAALAGVFALAVGLAVGDPGSGMLVPVGVAVGLLAVGGVVVWPFAGFLALTFSLFLLIVVFVPATQRSVNVFDLVMLPLLAASVFGSARRAMAEREGGRAGPAHEAVRVAIGRVERSTLWYFGLAGLSLSLLLIQVGSDAALSSGLKLARAVQGALVFPLGLWWLRDERHVKATLRTVFVAAVAFAVVNGVWVLALGYPRAGIVWWMFDTREPAGSPNEAATALLILWALVQASRAAQPRRWHMLLMAVVLLMLPLTQSRSGLLAFATYLLLTVRHVRWRWVLALLLLAAAVVPLMPGSFWTRMGHSLSLESGSFALFTMLLRFYGYQIAWQVFLGHPLLGVGYLGLRFVSAGYSEFGLALGAENYFLETLAGMGIIGLVVLSIVFVRLFALGRVVRQSTAAGTLGHELARRHGPLLIALLVANLTGDNFVGMVGVGQVALWCALLVRAGHLAVPRTEAA